MKISFLAILLFLVSINFAFSQDYPVRNDSSLIKKLHIRSISTIFNSISEGKRYDSMEVGRIDFDENGNILREKYFRLFDIMLTSQENLYKYDTKGRLIEEIENYKDQPQTKEDSAKQDYLGHINSKNKLVYEYDDKDRIVQILNFIKEEDKAPSLSTEFEYDEKGNKVKAIFKHLKAPQQTSSNNRIENYKYDENNRLVETKMKWTTTETASTTTCIYDSLGNMISESTLHYDGREFKKLFYYKNGKIHFFERYQSDIEEWGEKRVYEYSEKGHLAKKTFYFKIEDEKNQDGIINTFEYNDEGLLGSEYWYSDGEKSFSFETTYTYFD